MADIKVTIFKEVVGAIFALSTGFAIIHWAGYIEDEHPRHIIILVWLMVSQVPYTLYHAIFDRNLE